MHPKDSKRRNQTVAWISRPRGIRIRRQRHHIFLREPVAVGSAAHRAPPFPPGGAPHLPFDRRDALL